LPLQVHDPMAARLMALPRLYREWAVRDAVEKTFAGALARAQGVFVVHYHGGARRPFGHPHAHAVLSPRLQGGAALQYIPRSRLARIKESWEREIAQAVTRFERRAPTRFAERVPLPELAPNREASRGSFGERLLELAARRAATTVLGRPTGAFFRTAGYTRAAGSGPAALFRRVAPRLAETVAPAPLRSAL